MSTLTAVGLMPWPVVWAPAPPATSTLSADTHYVGVVFQAPATTDLINVYFRTGGTVTTAGNSFTGGIYQVDATTGFAGTQVGSNFTAITGGLNINQNYSFTPFGAGTYSLTAGNVYVVKLFRTAGDTFNGQIVRSSAQLAANNAVHSFPYQIINVGSDVKRTTGDVSNISLEFTGNVFYPLAFPTVCGDSTTTTLVNSTITSGGIKFQLATPVTCAGFWMHIPNTNNVTGTVELGNASLIPGTADANRLAVYSGWDEDVMAATEGTYYGFWDSMATVDLSASTVYRLVFRNSSATNISLRHLRNIPAQAHITTIAGTSNYHLCTYNAGWTDTATTSVPGFGLLISKVHDGTASGGGVQYRNNMKGNLG